MSSHQKKTRIANKVATNSLAPQFDGASPMLLSSAAGLPLERSVIALFLPLKARPATSRRKIVAVKLFVSRPSDKSVTPAEMRPRTGMGSAGVGAECRDRKSAYYPVCNYEILCTVPGVRELRQSRRRTGTRRPWLRNLFFMMC